MILFYLFICELHENNTQTGAYLIILFLETSLCKNALSEKNVSKKRSATP